MLATALQVLVAPLLVAASTLAAGRFGPRTGGLVSAFPAIVGPVLLITAGHHGEAFAAQAAAGTLLGLVTLSAFALAFGRAASRARWPMSLVAGWAAAAVTGIAAGSLGAGLLTAFAVAVVSLAAAHRLLPRSAAAAAAPPAPAWDLPARMALTAVLVVALAAAAGLVGPLVGGMLAALPVLASVLAVFTHARYGPDALGELLRGMLAGMSGFVAFCAVVALVLEAAGTAATFSLAAAAAVGTQTLALAAPRVRWGSGGIRPAPSSSAAR